MPVLRLSEAGQMDLARASDLVTDSMSAMGIEIEDLPHYLDVVAQAARSSNTDIDQLMEAYIGVGGVLRGLNVPIEESAVALGMLANAGIKGSEGGTALSAVMTNLTAPTGRAQKALEELGFSAFDSQGNFKGMGEVLLELKGKLEGLDAEQRNNYLSMIAGKGHIDGLNALINGLDDSYDKLTDSIGDSKGALDDMADAVNDNNKGSLKMLKASLDELGLKIYDTLKPAIADVTDFFQKFADKLNELTPEQQETISQFVKLALVIGPVLMLIGKLTKGVGKFYFILGDVAKGMRAGKGLLTALLGPAGQVLIVAGLLAGAGYLIYKNWDKIKSALEPLINFITDEFYPRLQSIVESIGVLFNGLWEVIGPIINDFIIASLKELAVAFELLKAVIEFVGGVIGDIVLAVLDDFQSLLDFVQNVFTGNWEGAWENIKSIFSGKIDLIKSIWNRLKTLLSKTLKPKIDVIYDAFKRGVDKVREMWEGLKEFLRHPIRGTVNLFRGGDVGENARGTNYWRGGPTWVSDCPAVEQLAA